MFSRAWATRFGVLVALYVVGDWLGEHLLHGPDQVTLVWLPAGVALAALVLYRRRAWPFIPLAELIVQLLPDPAQFNPLFTAFTMTANTLGALVGASVLRPLRRIDGAQAIRSGLLLVLAALALALASAVVGVSGLWVVGYTSSADLGAALAKWLTANVFGVLLVTPAVMLIAQKRRWDDLAGLPGSWAGRSETLTWLVLMLAAFGLLLNADRTTSDYVLGLASLPLSLLVWSALRFPPWQTAIASLAVGLCLTLLAGLGKAGFTPPERMLDALILLTFLCVVAVVPLLLAAAAQQNRVVAARLLHQAQTDSLTGLPNRSGFEAAARQRLAAAAGAPFALLYLDLDSFKLVNDNAGHAAGDDLVRALAGGIRADLQGGPLLARLGGDEFAVLLQETDEHGAEMLAERLREGVAGFRFPFQGHVFATTASIGVVPFRAAELDYAQALAQADAACFTAKELGGNRVQVSRGGEDAVAERTTAMRWAARLTRGIEGDHFQIYCQSIVPLTERAAHGRHYEVLIRLLDPDSGELLMPGQFVPAAERFRMGPRLDRHVLDRSLRWLEARPDWVAETEVCAINLCAASVDDQGFIDYLQQRLQQSSVPASKLCLEITETSAVRDLGDARRFIDRVRQLGCRLALDDFGSGFCSFAYLHALDVDYFKIDGSFVRQIESSPLSVSIVRALADIAASIGKQTVAEFVESDAIRRQLGALGVGYGQGYGIDHPVPIEQFFAMPAPAAGPGAAA